MFVFPDFALLRPVKLDESSPLDVVKNSTFPVFKELHFSGKYSSITRLDALHCVLAYYYFCFYTFILDRYTEKILIFQQIFSLAQDIKLKNFYLYSI